MLATQGRYLSYSRLTAGFSYAVVLCALLFCVPPFASDFKTHTQEKRHNHSKLHEVVVSASQPIAIFNMDRSATVFTAEDIAHSAAQSVPDLLASAPNITLTSFSGNEKFTRLDVRGSGDTSVSNVLTLIDGIKINTPDLAGADFSSVSLNHVERIEIIRGGNSVRYGSGASHGVINIITKRPAQSSVFALRERGSFASDRTLFAATIGGERASLMLNHVDYQSDGYRAYNTLDSNDFLMQFRQQLNTKIHLLAKVQRHRDTYQLPGPLSRQALDAGDIEPDSGDFRRGTSGETEDFNNQFQLRYLILETLSWTTNLQQREREDIFKFGEILKTVPVSERDQIDLTTVAADSQLNWQPDASPLSLTVGIDYNHSDYSRSNGGQSTLRRTLTSGKVISRAAFAHARIQASSRLTFNTGYRHNKTRNQYRENQLDFDTSDPVCVGQSQFLCPVTDLLIRKEWDAWHNEAFELGLVFALTPDTRLYTSAAKTFRIPNVDELALPLFTQNSANTDSTLKPQTARRYEAGIKFDSSYLALNLAGFYANTNDEIIFRETGDPAVGVNFNFTRPINRSGVELDTTIYWNNAFSSSLNAGYTSAKTDDNKRIPLVPRVTASANISWAISPKVHFYHDLRYVGSRHDGNDFNSSGLYELPSYQVAGAKLQYKNNKQGFTAYLAANNIYNAQYITTSYSNAGYPANRRAIYGGISIEL